MLWIVNGLIYVFFMALYTIVNQKYHFNAYALGIWRGFGVAVLFLPLLIFVPLQTDWHNWCLLILQGVFMGIYDSRVLFSSVKYGAGTVSRLLVLSVPVTTFIWWLLTPYRFVRLLDNGSVFVTLILALVGFCYCYWQMIKSAITRQALESMLPAVLALAGMGVATKEIAMMGQNIWQNILYYLVVASLVSGGYNSVCLWQKKSNREEIRKQLSRPELVHCSAYLIGLSIVLMTAKTMAMRLAPNPGYVMALLLLVPLFVLFLGTGGRRERALSAEAEWSMLFFLIMIMVLVNGRFDIND